MAENRKAQYHANVPDKEPKATGSGATQATGSGAPQAAPPGRSHRATGEAGAVEETHRPRARRTVLRLAVVLRSATSS